VFLNATRALNNENHIGLKFLIGSVEDFVQSKINNVQRNASLQTDVEWLTFQELCKDSGIGLFYILQGVPNFENNLGNLSHNMGQFFYSLKQEENYKRQFIGHFYDKFYVYAFPKDESKMRIIPLLSKIFEVVKNELVIQFLNKEGSVDQICDDFKIFKEKMIGTTNENKEDSILNNFSILNWIEFENITKFDGSLESPMHSVSFLWFKSTNISVLDRNGRYIPTIVYNKGTNKLNFLVWYSDMDNSGLMRHAAIEDKDVLSLRLARYAKMLVYCEDDVRQAKCSGMLIGVLDQYINTINNLKISKDNTTNLKQRIEFLFESGNVYYYLEVIPLLNKYFYQERKTSKICNIFSNLGLVQACVKSILGPLNP